MNHYHILFYKSLGKLEKQGIVIFSWLFFVIMHVCAGMPSDSSRVHVVELPATINTSFSEYNGILLPDSTFFFVRLQNKSISHQEDPLFDEGWASRLYRSREVDDRTYSEPEPLPRQINSPKMLTANFCFAEDSNHLIFTRCYLEENRKHPCSLWESYRRDGKWSKAVRLPESVNRQHCRVTQPFWVPVYRKNARGRDGDAPDHAILYFVSDCPGGHGGTDIWYVVVRKGRYSNPVNAGSLINSKGNETTPFYDTRSQRLYFSSDGLPGLGQHDIFYSKGSLSKWEKPTHIEAPVNSSWNDHYFSLNADGVSGYFCSNRPRTGDMSEACCYNIYAFTLPKEKTPPATTIVPSRDSLLEQLRQYLPLSLYFHNDEPDPKSLDSTTSQTYPMTLNNYIALEEQYMNQCEDGSRGQTRQEAEREMKTFFEQEVREGMRRLEAWVPVLLQVLRAGYPVTLVVSGYASALHRADYNTLLTSRRVYSLVNYLRTYEDGVFLPYLNGTLPNHLVVKTKALGNTEALKKKVNADPRNQRLSIYGIEAAKERRVEISEVE
ncbi:MAG: hypothetical protein LBR51_00045 [Bacteroidales bacterium]|nr:hypothetical protein [Bacteroidales bacterium]